MTTGVKTLFFSFDWFSFLNQEKHGPVGLVHVDAHSDTNDTMFGEKVTHGTPFRRAVEEGLLDCKRVIQIGLRGTGYTGNDYQWPEDQVDSVNNNNNDNKTNKPRIKRYILFLYITVAFSQELDHIAVSTSI